MTAAIADAGGRVIDTQGDAFFAAFTRARDAVAAAVAAQRAHATHAWPPGAEMRVRMGLDTGEPTVGADRYVGLGIHRTARIMAAGHGGQVLLSVRRATLCRAASHRDHAQEPRRAAAEGSRPSGPHLPARDGRPADGVSPAPHSRRGGRERASRTQTSRRRGDRSRRRGRCCPHRRVGHAERRRNGITVGRTPWEWIDPNTNSVVGQIPVRIRPGGIDAGADSVWVTNGEDQTLSRIDANRRAVVRTIPLGATPTDVAEDERAVWVAEGPSGQ